MIDDPKNMNDAVAMLTKAFVFMRSVQSALPPHSEMWKCAGKSCTGIEDSIRMIERIPKASIGPMVIASPTAEPTKDKHPPGSLTTTYIPYRGADQ